ncbi:calmodulin-binding-domain-containing protein [Paraphysoderma sedebokerense]|nr:calmodulin-binding-domain-containing protein [Paraphysoderma sedebokerense]
MTRSTASKSSNSTQRVIKSHTPAKQIRSPTTSPAKIAVKTLIPLEPKTRTSQIPDDPFVESVYNLIPVTIPPPDKAPRYKSMFSDAVKAEYESGMKDMASMGPVKVITGSPEKYLRKGDGFKVKAEVPRIVSERTFKKPAVPKGISDIPTTSKKDFVRLNALNNIHSPPKQLPKAPSAYVDKKDYGKAPEYLLKRKEELIQAKVKEADITEESEQKPGLILLPEDERLKLLEGLKNNWEKLNSDYQKLSLTVDTVPKIARKVNIEQQLKRIEEDIQKFSHQNIYVNFLE